MTTGENENDGPTQGIDDEQLPDDLQPSEDNPLAQPLDEDVDTEELEMEGGKGAEQDGGDDGSGQEDDGSGAGGGQDHAG